MKQDKVFHEMWATLTDFDRWLLFREADLVQGGRTSEMRYRNMLRSCEISAQKLSCALFPDETEGVIDIIVDVWTPGEKRELHIYLYTSLQYFFFLMVQQHE